MRPHGGVHAPPEEDIGVFGYDLGVRAEVLLAAAGWRPGCEGEELAQSGDPLWAHSVVLGACDRHGRDVCPDALNPGRPCT